MASIFMERKLPDLQPMLSRGRRSSLSRSSTSEKKDGTFLINLSPIKRADSLEDNRRKKVRDNDKKSGKVLPQSAEYKEVRRKLTFGDDDSNTPVVRQTMDFTDKMAAFRQMLKRDALRESKHSENRKDHGNNGQGHDNLDFINADIRAVREVRNNLPKSRESRALLSKLADEELANMSRINYEAQMHSDLLSEKNSREKGSRGHKSSSNQDKNAVKSDANIANLVSNSSDRRRIKENISNNATNSQEAELNELIQRPPEISHQRLRRIHSHEFDPDLDRIPQRDTHCQNNSKNCDKSKKCQKHSSSRPLSEAGYNDVASMRLGDRSIQSNVPHFHPSWESPRETSTKKDIYISKQQGKSSETVICQGVRTGEVIYSKSGLNGPKIDFTQTNVRHYGASVIPDDALPFDDRAHSQKSGRSKSKGRGNKEKRKSGRSPEEKLRKNIRDLKRDLDISDSSKENILDSGQKERRHRTVSNEDSDGGELCVDELVSSPRVSRSNRKGQRSGSAKKVNTDAQFLSEQDATSARGKRRKGFGPRYPESENAAHGAGPFDLRPSEGSISGSTRSLASQSSTVMAVELLRKLYKIENPQTRQDLILKAKCFRRWLKNVQPMQSIEERSIDAISSALAQSMKDAYVQGSRRGANGVAGFSSACLTDIEELAGAFDDFLGPFDGPLSVDCLNTDSHTARVGHTDFEKQGTSANNGTDRSRKTTKVAPITKENLEKHTQIQSNVLNFPKFEESKSAFTRFKRVRKTSGMDPNNKPGDTETNKISQSHPNYLTSQYESQSQHSSHLEQGANRVAQSDNMTGLTGASINTCRPIIMHGMCKSVADSARIARGLGRVTRVVAPITENMQLLDTANYGVCLQSAEIFSRKCILTRSFAFWKKAAAEAAILRAADNLRRIHTLRKGMSAFKWAINRSRIMVEIFQTKMKGMLLTSCYAKWYDKAMKNRQERLVTSFKKWKHFTVESQKVRNLRTLSDRKSLLRAMEEWKCKFYVRLKENAAKNHYRRHLLSQTIVAWRIFTLNSQEKQKSNEMARTFYADRLQSKMFAEMVIVYKKFTVAKKHHRSHHLHRLFVIWRQATVISKTEHKRDMQISQEHWTLSTLRKYFVHWHDTLMIERTQKTTEDKLVHNAFLIWRTRWQLNVQYREEVEAQIRQEILHSSLICWRENVATLKKRREAAVIFVQRVLVRHALHGWNNYTRHKKRLSEVRENLRLIEKTYKRKQDLKVQRKYMSKWRSEFEDKLDVQRAKTFWSNTCVRKAFVQWKKFCHKRALKRLLLESEPQRQRTLQHVMFKRWSLAKARIENEKMEAKQTRSILDRSHLQRRFNVWKAETELRLRIRPMIQRRQNLLLSESFEAWHGLVQHKKQCRHNHKLFHRSQLRTAFTVWRRQYLIHQIEADIKQKMLTSYLRRCVQGWRSVIKRKHAAQKFHDQQLIQQTFVYWKNKAVSQLRERVASKEIQEWNVCIMRHYFDTWWSNAQQQRSEKEAILQSLDQQKAANRLCSSFITWRRFFRATLVARENQKYLRKKMMQRALSEWHIYTQRSMKRAVFEFAVSLGLQPPEECSIESFNTSSGSIEDEQEKIHLMMMSEDIGSGAITPYSSSARGTPMKKLFSPALSRVSLDLDRSIPEVDLKHSLSNSTFIDARFEMEQAVKTERMKDIVTTMVKRLRFWPVSIVFDHWRDHTVQQRELRALSSQFATLKHQMELRMVFRIWSSHFTSNTKARTYRDNALKRKVFTALQQNKRKMKYKKQLSSLAHNYNSLTVFRKIFPMWFEKAQEKRHKERIVRLWTTVTTEEEGLLPVEKTLRNRLDKKTLTKCFSLWHIKFLQIHKLKVAYNNIILKRCVEAWHVWAKREKEQRDKCIAFCHRRLTSQAFKRWLIRKRQRVAIKKKHTEMQNQQQLEIVQCWHKWAAATRKRKMVSLHVTQTLERHLVLKTFTSWKDQFRKQQEVKRWYEERQMIRVLCEWHYVAQWQAQVKQKTLSFQVTSYTRTVIRMFKVWKNKFLERLQQKEAREQLIQRRTLQIGRKWRQKAQKTRGRQLQQVFLNRNTQRCFTRWKYRYERNLERENQLRKVVVRKNRSLIGQYMDTWKTSLMMKQATRVYDSKLTATLFHQWHVFTAESKQRQYICTVYQKAKEQRSLSSYFSYWTSLTRVQHDIKKHCDLKLQIRVLREWHIYAKRRRQLSVLGSVMTKHVKMHMLQKYWHIMREKTDYCHSLSDMATKVVEEKNRALVTLALDRWRDQLNRVIAGRCYHQLLALRGIRQWRRFVYQRKQERKHEQEMNEKATKHHNRKLCKLAFRLLHNEVKVKHMVQHHKDRLAAKYGQLWKLRVDMMYTAICVEEENVIHHTWRVWRVAFAKRLAAHKVAKYNDRQLLSQMFNAWKGTTFKKINTARRTLQTSFPPSPVPSAHTPPVQSESVYRPSMIPGPKFNSSNGSSRNHGNRMLKKS